jgi:hypothetical protein
MSADLSRKAQPEIYLPLNRVEQAMKNPVLMSKSVFPGLI